MPLNRIQHRSIHFFKLPTTFGLDHRCYKVRREQAVGTEDAKVPAMNNDVQVQGRVTFLQTLAV